jgi:hypothetical protein
MSFDMVILRPIGADVTDLADVEDVIDFGAHESVTASLESVFPGCVQGTFSNDSSYSLESTLSGDPVVSVHLTLQYGATWTEAISDEFVETLSSLCKLLDSIAFAVSDNSRIAPAR